MKQINHVTTKLNQAIGILNTLRNNTSLKTQKMTYHSLFSSHLLYGSQLWGHTNLTNQNKIQKLQNRALRKILLKKQDSMRQYYKELQILKFTSSSLIIHTFLNIATAATGIIPTIDILYVCIYVHVMHMCIYGFMYILKLDLC